MLRRWRRANRRVLMAGGTMVAAVALMVGVADASGVPINPFGTNPVGTQANGRILLPDNQWIQPYGQRTTFSAESIGGADSPDGTKVVVQTNFEAGVNESPHLEVLDATSGKVLQTFGGTGITAPLYSPDGSALYAATPTDILKYAVGANGLITNPTSPTTIPLPSNSSLPYGLAVSPDGTKLYAALSTTNQLAVIDTTTDQVVSTVRVGNDPQDVAIIGQEAFVSDRGGRPAGPDDTTNNSDGTPIVSSRVTGAATTGTVSVVDLATNKVTDTIHVGLQPTSLTVQGRSLFVTNTDSDTVSIIDANSHRVTQTVNVEPLPGTTVGAAPNSLAFVDPHHFLVSVGRDNALAEFLYNGPNFPVQYQGLIPTDWYPNQVIYDAAAGKVIVSNEKGVGTDGAATPFLFGGTVTSFRMPTNPTLGALTSQVFNNNGWDHLTSSNQLKDQGDQGGVPPAIPTQLGQPSAIKHVFLVIKENRSYDQVLGDLRKGNGDPSETDFGAEVTPNEHSLANIFTDFDNFYDNGSESGDGHNWLMQADANDYLEQDQASAWVRTYPYPGGDALAYQSDGFLWNTVERAGKSVKDYGEYESLANGTPSNAFGGPWQEYYADSQILEGKAAGPLPVPLNQYQYSSDVPSLNAISNPDYPNFELNIPDQYRVDIWEQDFKKEEQTGNLPDLTILWLPDDHTGGTPTPQAQVADNDLAVGRVVSEISHSQFWKNSAVFVTEDDTALGTDHVDGHRAPLWIASPYAERGVVNSDYDSQINVVKTVEQILGAQPMNQMDRAAVPMFSAFTNKPNFTPYDVLPNQIPITQGVTGLIPMTPTASVKAANPSAAATTGTLAPPVPPAAKPLASAWMTWYKTEAEPKLTGPHAVPDSVNPPQLDRYDWYTTTGWTKPYPGEKQILLPNQVPERNVPSSFLGGD